MQPIIPHIKQKQIAQLLTQAKRIDGREPNQHRPIQIERAPITTAEGSAHVRLGKTEVMVGVKIDNLPSQDFSVKLNTPPSLFF